MWRSYWSHHWLLKITGLVEWGAQGGAVHLWTACFPARGTNGPRGRGRAVQAGRNKWRQVLRGPVPEPLGIYYCIRQKMECQEMVKSGVSFSVVLCRYWKLWLGRWQNSHPNNNTALTCWTFNVVTKVLQLWSSVTDSEVWSVLPHGRRQFPPLSKFSWPLLYPFVFYWIKNYSNPSLLR